MQMKPENCDSKTQEANVVFGGTDMRAFFCYLFSNVLVISVSGFRFLGSEVPRATKPSPTGDQVRCHDEGVQVGYHGSTRAREQCGTPRPTTGFRTRRKVKDKVEREGESREKLVARGWRMGTCRSMKSMAVTGSSWKSSNFSRVGEGSWTTQGKRIGPKWNTSMCQCRGNDFVRK